MLIDKAWLVISSHALGAAALVDRVLTEWQHGPPSQTASLWGINLSSWALCSRSELSFLQLSHDSNLCLLRHFPGFCVHVEWNRGVGVVAREPGAEEMRSWSESMGTEPWHSGWWLELGGQQGGGDELKRRGTERAPWGWICLPFHCMFQWPQWLVELLCLFWKSLHGVWFPGIGRETSYFMYWTRNHPKAYPMMMTVTPIIHDSF